MDLDAKRAAHIFANDTHIGFGNAQMTRKYILHHVGRLRALVNRQQVFGRVVVCQNAAWFVGHASVSTEFVNLFHHHVGFGKLCLKILSDQFAAETFVVAQISVNDHVAGQRGFHVGHNGQEVPFNQHMVEGVFCLTSCLRHNGRHCFALRAGSFWGNGVLRCRPNAFEVT